MGAANNGKPECAFLFGFDESGRRAAWSRGSAFCGFALDTAELLGIG